jgi:hypothetical protein
MRNAVEVTATLASAVIVLTGLVALIRSMLRIRDVMRDNTVATQRLTVSMDSLLRVGGRLEKLERRVSKLERIEHR